MARKKKTKLKTTRLVESHKPSRFLTWTRVVRYGFRNLTRNAWLSIAAIIVMVITLLVIFATGLASSILAETIDAQRAKMDLSFYIKHDASDDILRNLAGKLRIQPNVKKVSISNSEDEYKKALKNNIQGWSLVSSEHGQETLASVIHVKLYDINKRNDIEKSVKNDPQFKEWTDTSVTDSQSIEARQTTIDKLSNIMNYASRVGGIVAAVFVVISVLIIFNTIRMTIFSRRDEIRMEQSIGADNYFIRGPFLVEAELYGIIAGIIAMILGYLLLTRILPSLGSFIEVSKTTRIVRQWWLAILAGMIAIGYVVGNLSARMALRKYLKK